MKKQRKLIPHKQFANRLLKYSLISLILVAFSLGLGVLGYHFIGGLNFVDSFYNASMILTGMGPVNIMPTNAAKIFSSFYALFSGVAFLTTFAIFVSPIVHRLMKTLHIDDDDLNDE